MAALSLTQEDLLARPIRDIVFRPGSGNRWPSSICTGPCFTARPVVVIEGFVDDLNVHQAGLPCVVALMGGTLSQQQERLLQQHFQEVILLLDGDRAGRTAGVAIAARLCSKISIRLVEIPSGTQPDQLGADQIRCLCIPGYF